MARAPRALLGLILVSVAACGSTPTVTSNGSPGVSPAASGSLPQASSNAAFDALRGDVPGLAARTGIVDIGREQLIDALGLRASLGSSADQVLALVAATEDAARAQEKLSSATGATARFASVGGVFADLPVAPAPPPDDDVRQLLPGVVTNVGLPGDTTTAHQPTQTADADRTSGELTGKTQMTTTLDAAINGSVATVQVGRTVHSVVTDSAAKVVFEQTTEYQIIGQLDVCPTVEGIVIASVVNTATADATTAASLGGGVGSHSRGSFTSTSSFRGHVDDAAVLGAVSQDYKHDEMFKRTTSANAAADEGSFSVAASGVNDGVPASHEWSLDPGDWSGATGTAHLTGSATQKMLDTSVFSAALDYTTIDASYVAAQPRWRKGVCVVVTSPTYGVESDPNATGVAHTEEVAKGSKTVFQVGLKHRYGAAVSASITAELSAGKESLTPGSIDKPPGSLTYEAPNEDGKDATVRLVSTSRQGIGTLVLAFHTGVKMVQIGISGTSKTSGLGVSYTTTVSAPKVVLKKQPDGTYLGSGPVTATVTVKGLPCPAPFTESGTLVLRATPAESNDPTTTTWTVIMDPTTSVQASGQCLGQSLAALLQLGDRGATGDFMTGLGDVAGIHDGDALRVQRTKAIGPAQITVDATVKFTVVSAS